jgi:hypothetical protein
MKTIIAADPGLSGGLVAGDITKPAPCLTIPMPSTEADVVDFLREVKIGAGALHTDAPSLVIEKLPLFVSVPGGRVSGASMAKLHRNAGILTGAALALGIRIVEVDPHSWQKHFRLGTKKSAGGYTAWKNVLKGEAQKRFPAIKVTHALADSLLIWEFAKTLK